MRTNRHVPLILGTFCVAGAGYLIVAHGGIWTIIIGALLLAFGIPSIKTGLFASRQELRELTGEAPLSEETKRKLEDRV